MLVRIDDEARLDPVRTFPQDRMSDSNQNELAILEVVELQI